MNDYSEDLNHGSDTQAGVCYCGNWDCKLFVQGCMDELRLAKSQLADVIADRDRMGQASELLNKRVDSLAQQVDAATMWLVNQKDEMSGEEFVAVYEELAEILGVHLTEDVTVEVVMTQTLVVKVPLGTDLSEQDFWANGRSNGMLDCNYTIESEEGDIEIEDIRMNNRY